MPGSSPPLALSHPLRLTSAILPGAREWLLLALLAFALFGRAAATGPGRLAARWLARPRPIARRSPTLLLWVAERWLAVLVALAGLALVAWLGLAWGILGSQLNR